MLKQSEPETAKHKQSVRIKMEWDDFENNLPVTSKSILTPVTMVADLKLEKIESIVMDSFPAPVNPTSNLFIYQ